VIGSKHLDDLEPPDLPSRFTLLYQFTTAHAAPAIFQRRVLTPYDDDLALQQSAPYIPAPIQQHAQRPFKSEPKRHAIGPSSLSEPWIGPGHETASSAAGLIALSVAGRAHGAAGYDTAPGGSPARGSNACFTSRPRSRGAGRAPQADKYVGAIGEWYLLSVRRPREPCGASGGGGMGWDGMPRVAERRSHRTCSMPWRQGSPLHWAPKSPLASSGLPTWSISILSCQPRTEQ